MASTRTYGGEGRPVEEQSLGELFATMSRDMSLLVRQEIDLAKSELGEAAKRAGMGAGGLSARLFVAEFVRDDRRAKERHCAADDLALQFDERGM